MEPTRFAPANRSSLKVVHDEFSFIKNVEYIEKLIDALPYVGAILNENRQIVFANQTLLDLLGIQTLESILGLRPGEAVKCVNANNQTGGCGTAEACSVCGAVNSIMECLRTGQPVSSECRIISQLEGEIQAFDFKVYSRPIQFGPHNLIVFSLIDISSDKRRKALERVFFHDILNKTGSLQGFIELLKKETEPSRITEFIRYLEILNNDLTEEILAQRQLSSAEHGELKVNPGEHNSLEMCRMVQSQMLHHEVALEKSITVWPQTESIALFTDGVILRRVLMNMVKNALEASKPGGAVVIGCHRKNTEAVFFVQNATVMSEKVKLQVFQRSFSTKGNNRGLGTYSMKLFAENYLKGRVSFESSEGIGTIFYIHLPLALN